MTVDLREMKILAGIPVNEAKMPPRTKKSIHTSSRGTDFTLCPVKLTTTYPKDAPSGGGKMTWKEVKKSSRMDNDWLVRSRSDQAVGILSYDDFGKEWNLNKLRGKEVRAMVAASGKDLAKVLDHA